jgi:hypothetical protein
LHVNLLALARLHSNEKVCPTFGLLAQQFLKGRVLVFSPFCEAMQGRTVMLLAAALLGAFVWQSAFVQTSGTGAKVSNHAQVSAQGRLPEMMESQDEGVNSFVSLGCGVLAGLVVAVAGASPALAQRNQFGFTTGMDEEVKKLDVGAKSSGLLSQLGSTSGDPKWDPKEKVVYPWGGDNIKEIDAELKAREAKK